MYRIIRKHNRKLLAIFAAFLMVVFILPTTFNRYGGRTNPVIAHIGDEEIRAEEVQTAEAEWRILNQVRGFRSQLGNLPLAFMLGWGPMSELELLQGRAPYPFVQINENPRLFLLLKREAQQMGVSVSQDQVNDVITNQLGILPDDPEQRQQIQQAVADLLLVNAGFRRAASTVKISEPLLKHELARQQSIRVSLVEFNASDFGKDIAAPTTQQLQGQFETFASQPRGTRVDEPPIREGATPTTNPFGFGYRYPNRVKLQYIAIPRQQVRSAIESSRTPYEWEVAARKYYQENLSSFPTTQKATTAPSSGLELTASTQASTGPTTRPFEEVREDAKNRVLVPEVDKKMAEAQSLISTTLTADWLAYRNAAGKSSSAATQASAPVTSLGVPYNSYEYLEKLADRVQQQTKIRPTVVSLTDQWRSPDALGELEGIGRAATADGMNLSTYVATLAEPFVPQQQRENANVLSVWEPSQPLREAGQLGTGDAVYIFRLTDVQAAHQPDKLDEVADEVRSDYLAQQRYELAKQQAQKLLEAARQSGLASAASQAGKTVVTTGEFQNQPSGEIPGYTVPPDARPAFIDQAFDLLSSATSQPSGKPTRLIELPRSGKVIVAELEEVKTNWDKNSAPQRIAGLNQQLRDELERYFMTEWFSFEDAKKRLNYRTENGSDEQSGTANAAT